MVLRCPVLPSQLQPSILLADSQHAGHSLLPMNRRNSDSRANELGIRDDLECRGDPLLLRFHILLHLGTLGLGVTVLGLGIVLDHWGLPVSTSVYEIPGAFSRILRRALVCMLKFRASRRQWGRVQ